MIYTVVMSPQCGLWNLEASIFNLQINLCGRDLSDSTEFTSYGRRIFMERTSLLCLKTLSRRSSFPIRINGIADLKYLYMFLGFDENDGDDDIREEFLCPFCSEYFDIVGLCCHIDEEHPVEAKNGVCPVCTLRVGVDMVAHITLQHGNILKISFFTCRKRKSRKGGSYSTLSLLRKELREGNLQTLFGGSSCIVSSSNAAPDPLLSSFILPVAEDLSSSQPHLSTDTRPSKKSSDEEKQYVKPSTLSDKDKEEKAKRCTFVQGLLLSTILDDKL
ncbi:hypothetical protein Ahy_A06g027339 isoform D [Arachis hypogaea]|uniref:Drought induced 19 protein type zinc-binding domain-containing protein n=1 Tax=Arachis hypogaea TaxID=3818 RepID=A0A445CNB3_ARAHY|nr:hypothetical protein Ahy_A06g027339 isoform D [Arachis hypogaea]